MKSYNKYFAKIDDLVGNHEQFIATFYHKNIQVPRGTAAANGFGSGFLIDHPKGIVVVTAEHVARQATKEKIVYLRIGSNILSLERQRFITERSVDLAVSLFTFEQLEQESVGTLSAIKVNSDIEPGVPTSIYVVLGYPSTRNKLDQRFKGKNPAVHSLSLETAKIEKFSGTEIPVPLLLHYEPGEMILGVNMPKDGKPFDLHGMSGGPVFEVLATPQRNAGAATELELSFSLAGVALEWHVHQKLVVGTRVELLRHLIGYL